MSQKVGPKDFDITLKFGGGLHTRASPDEINPREAADGRNFLLDVENKELRNRKPFDLIGTVPNAAEIRGGASLLKADGSVSLLIQAGNKVYEWDGLTTFTERGTVNANARLRGHWRTHNWSLDNLVLITDLSLLEVVKQWDGTTLSSVAFKNGSASGASFSPFYAKYLNISDERAIFANVRDAGGSIPHMIVGSERSDYETISVADRPSSSLSEADPFFLLTPDLRSINGFVQAFGTSVVSTQKGRLFNLTGASAKDFQFDEFYAGSAASGDESMAYVGNDVIYGRQGRVESLRDTDRFGDSEADDITAGIADQVEGDTGWRIVYNSRINRTYLLPDGVSEAWSFQNAMRGGEVSPWMRWKTQHPLAFQPTFIMSMLDPRDGLEYVFMGDASGNWYRMEGSGTGGDGGTSPIAVEWLSKVFSAPLDMQFSGIEGYIKYRKKNAARVTLTMQFAGETAYDEEITVDLPGVTTNSSYYSGDAYYGGDFYYSAAFENRLLRQRFFPAGQANDFQLKVSVDGTSDVGINEIGFRLKAAST